jgi:hypothetical protein
LKTTLQAFAIGTAVTLALFGLGFAAVSAGAEVLSYGLYWQAYLLHTLMPCDYLWRGEFLCQSMLAAKIAFYSGLPLGILLYSAIAYVILRLRRRAAA